MRSSLHSLVSVAQQTVNMLRKTLGTVQEGVNKQAHFGYWWRIVKLCMIPSFSMHSPRSIVEFTTNIKVGESLKIRQVVPTETIKNTSSLPAISLFLIYKQGFSHFDKGRMLHENRL